MVITETEVTYGTFKFKRAEVGGFKYEPDNRKNFSIFIQSTKDWTLLGMSDTPWPFSSVKPVQWRDGPVLYFFLPEHILGISHLPGDSVKVWTANQIITVPIPLGSGKSVRGFPQDQQSSEGEDWVTAYNQSRPIR